MGFPAEGAEAAYRNSIDDVVRFFFMRHGDKNFRILNISERRYDALRFGHDAVVNAGFPDRHSPPLALALDLAERIHAFLDLGPRKTIAVHCASRVSSASFF